MASGDLVADATRSDTSGDRDIASSRDIVLQVDDLQVTIPHRAGDIYAVRQVSFAVSQGERIAILGESGSGKTMTVMSLLGLQPSEARVAGTMHFNGGSFNLGADKDNGRTVRRSAGIVFQDSLTSLNPIAKIGTQLSETLILRGWKRSEADAEAARVLGRVGVLDPIARMSSYPHELSGGMRQRVMITMALLPRPSLLIADEPTTALDATVQAQVIDLIADVQAENNMSLLLITHDLAMAAEACDRAIVMYAGYVVEDAPMAEILRAPRHPYVRALLHAMPRLDTSRDTMLEVIEGEPPSARETFTSCPFSARCPDVESRCTESLPAIYSIAPTHRVRCVHHVPVGASRPILSAAAGPS